MHSRSVSPVSSPSRLSDPTYVRDSRFYYVDGNTILLVDGTLFKVHRSVLTQDCSIFETLFSLDSNLAYNSSTTTAKEGETDDNPIRIEGSTVDEFRALLWALYALPHEIDDVITNADPKLFNLARLAHKYDFCAIQNWALDKIRAAYLRPTHQEAEGSILVKLTELASLCEHRELFDDTMTQWKRRIASRQDVALAIKTAERLDLRPFLGLAYYAMLQQGRKTWDADPQLTRTHRIRLLSGYYALNQLRERLENEPPTLQHHRRCTGNACAQCNQGWARLWRSLCTEEYAVPRGCKIFVGNLAYSTADKELIRFFAPVQNEIISVQIILRGTRSAGFGFVEVSSVTAARKAVASLNGQNLDGRKVIVEIAQPNQMEGQERAERPESLQHADVIDKLILAESPVKVYIQRELPDNGMLDAMPWCKEHALMATVAKLKEIQESLVDYFTDVA